MSQYFQKKKKKKKIITKKKLRHCPIELITKIKCGAAYVYFIGIGAKIRRTRMRMCAPFKSETFPIDRHISRISRENGKWFCETFLARNAAREIAGKIDLFLANLDPNLAKI